jgi:hypothetical protein
VRRRTLLHLACLLLFPGCGAAVFASAGAAE